MSLRIGLAAWALGAEASGARRRMLAILDAIPPLLASSEEILVLHRPGDLGPSGAPSESVRWIPVDLPAAPTWKRALRERRAVRGLVEDLGIHVLEFGTLPLPRRAGCPISLTVHDVRDADGAGTRPAWLARWIVRSALRRVAHLVVPSEFTALRLRRISGGLLPPLSVIPAGVDERLLDRAPLPGDHPRIARPFFLHVGHLEKRKNLLLLLSAYAGMLQDLGVGEGGDGALEDGEGRGAADEEAAGALPMRRVPALCFAGADHGVLRELRERAAMLGIMPHVHFLGGVRDEQLRLLYGACRAVMMPSVYEGFGMPALEALAAGRPVLVSDRGALPEVVGKLGQVLPHDDASAWSEAMAVLAHAPNVEPAAVVQARKGWAARTHWSDVAAMQLEAWRQAAATAET